MELRELIQRIGQTYDRTLGLTGEAQTLLKTAGSELRQWIPEGYLPVGSGGKGQGAAVPWIAVFDPDETRSATQGMYVVYLFAADMETVILSLNQGVTELVSNWGTREGRRLLRAQAEAIRGRLPNEVISDLAATINLRSTKALPIHYEHGNIVAKSYTVRALPDAVTMVADLQRFIQLYQEALAVREEIRRTTHGAIVTTTRASTSREEARPLVFKPKNDADYRATVARHELQKSRKHETLIRRYGEYLLTSSFSVATNVHPRDMVANTEDGREWLVEAKVVYQGDGVRAARDAVGQLLFYRHVYYEPNRHVGLLALFNEPVGEQCVRFMEALGIASVWKNRALWEGSLTSISSGLAGSSPQEG